ncbi:MAG: MtrB/PioB family decaheme-associated outer membrane protein [Rhodocyclales bacterium]|nr:MtrB/PioB family decaheme-associated outer membrane protein [Rhodocyclales bacterium]
MKNIGNESFAIKPLTLVVHGALVVMFGVPALAMAQGADQSVDEILRPTNFVEIGAANVGKSSTKFGEYNGLEKDGGALIGNFSVKGGNAYDRGEGTRRWEVNGSDLGTTNRTLDAKVGDQGKWNLGVGYDELRHYTPGPFKTPLVGNAGDNSFTLPAAFGAVNTAAPGTRGLTATQNSLFRRVDDLYSGRKNTNVTAGFLFNNQWGINFEYNNLTQTGAKLMSSGSSAPLLGTLGAAGVVGGNTLTGEAIMTVMNPTEYKTDTVKLSLDWKGEQGHLSAGYYGSFFRDKYNGFSWNSPFQSTAATGAAFVGNTNWMSTAPDNNFNQLNLSGGYTFRPATKLTGGLSYGRNTQNDAYQIDPNLLLGGVSPQSSLNGLVKTTHANLSVKDTSVKDLTLSAAFKYNKRDNQTQSTSYSFYDIGSGHPLRTISNLPYSNKKVQLELAGDYRLTKGQTLRLSYERENFDRWCNSLAKTTLNAGNQNGNNPTGTTDCAIFPHSKEDKLNAGYKLKMDNGVALKAGFFWAARMVDENHMAVGPLGATSVVPTYGTQAYVNNGNGYGFKPYFEAQRKEQGIKLGGSWEATEQLSFQADGRYSKVRFPDSMYGAQDGETATANIDATYTLSENSSIAAYGSRQLKTRFMHDNANSTIDWQLANSRQEWNAKLTDNETAIGLAGRFGGLMGNKLDLKADLSVSLGAYAQLTQNLYQAGTCDATTALTCGYLPEVKTSILTFKLEGDYKLDKASQIRLGYLFKRVMNNDYVYNIYQQSLTANAVMPTDQVAPRYSVNVLSASYIYSFK